MAKQQIGKLKLMVRLMADCCALLGGCKHQRKLWCRN